MRRRELLAGAATVLAVRRDEEPGARAAPWSSGGETPRLNAPPGTTDCHHYVYDHRYPAFSDAIKRPDDATPQDYRALMRRIGIRRQVLVQPFAYGADNRCLLDALAAFGGDTRAVAVVDTTVADAVLKRFDRLGVRGLFFNFAPSNGATTAMTIEPLARRIAPLGWHVEINVWTADLPPLLPVLRRLPTPVVLDRFGHVPEPEGPDHPLFAQIRRLIDSGNTWVKLVAPYDASKMGPPRYPDSGALARAYIDVAPERLVWGTNWPHPGEDMKPDDAAMFDLLADWAPEVATRNRILVKNPALLYRFPQSTRTPHAEKRSAAASVLAHSDDTAPTQLVMPGLVPGIHALATGATVCGKDVDGRAKPTAVRFLWAWPGHDDEMNPLFGSEH